MRLLRPAPLPAAALAIVAALACSSGGSAPPTVAAPAPTPMRVETSGGAVVDMSLTRSDPTGRFPIAATPDAVWAVLPGVYAELEIPVTTVVSSARRLGNPTHRVRRRLGGQRMSRFLSCGERLYQAVADTDNITLHLETVVSPAEGGALLTTVVEATARPIGVSGHPINCTSTGALEQRIVELIQEKLAK